jgi:hypothetical protein
MENFCKLVCSTFNSENKELRCEWLEEIKTPIDLIDYTSKYKIKYFKYPPKNTISEVLEGTFVNNDKDCIIHIRIIR